MSIFYCFDCFWLFLTVFNCFWPLLTLLTIFGRILYTYERADCWPFAAFFVTYPEKNYRPWYLFYLFFYFSSQLFEEIFLRQFVFIAFLYSSFNLFMFEEQKKYSKNAVRLGLLNWSAKIRHGFEIAPWGWHIVISSSGHLGCSNWPVHPLLLLAKIQQNH